VYYLTLVRFFCAILSVIGDSYNAAVCIFMLYFGLYEGALTTVTVRNARYAMTKTIKRSL